MNLWRERDRLHSELTLFFAQNSLPWRTSEAATGLMVAMHRAVVLVGNLSANLDKARLYILSGMTVGPIENISLEYKCCRKDNRSQITDETSECDKLVAVHGEVRDADPALLSDELGHGLQLLPADEDELPSVVNDPSQQSVLLQLVHSVNCFLSLQLELSGQVFQQDNLGTVVGQFYNDGTGAGGLLPWSP